MIRYPFLFFFSIALTAGGCGDDPVNYSKPVALNLKAKSEDVTAGALKAEKAITTESGNPFGAFINEASAKLGKAPSRIELKKLELLLATTSRNVLALNEVFDGAVDVQFVMNESNNVHPAGHATIDASVTGRGPIALTVDFDDSAMPASVDWQRFQNGSFKVVLAGRAASTFAGKDGEADFQLSLTFAAYE